MSTTVARLEAVLSAHTADFDRGMDKSETRMQKVGKTATRAGLLIAGGLAVGLTKSVHAAIDAQASQARLEQAFKTAGMSARLQEKNVIALEKASRKLGFTEEDVHQSLGSLIVATGNMKTATKDLYIAQDIARFKGIDLAAATKMLTMAQAGSQRATKQLGLSVQASTVQADALKRAHDALSPAMKKSTDEAYKNDLAVAKMADKHKTASIVIGLVQQKLHGQAEEFSKTAAGGMEQFKAQLNFLEISLGTALLPAITNVTAAAAKMSAWLTEHPKLVKVLVASLGALAAALLAVKIQQIAVNLAVLANPYVLATVAIIGMSAALFTLWNRSKQARTIIEIVTGVITMGLAPAIIETVRHWGDLTAAMGTAARAMSGAISTAVQGLNAGIHGMVRALGKVVDLFRWIIGAADKVGGALGKIGGAVGGAVGGIAGHLPNPLGEGGPAPPAGARGPVGGGNMGQVIGTANAIDSRHFPYLWGGGHSGSTMNGPYDCSGAVSALLRGAGLMSGSMVSGDFMNYGKPGMGKHISILANPEHVYTILNGKAWGTSGQNPGGGAGWFSGGVRSGFAIRHPEGFDSGGWLKPGLTLAMNNTGRPERILGPGEGGNIIHNHHYNGPVVQDEKFLSYLRNLEARFGRRNGRPAL